jgi:hypothetical protein
MWMLLFALEFTATRQIQLAMQTSKKTTTTGDFEVRKKKKKLDACRHLNTNRCKKWLQKRIKLPAVGVTGPKDSRDNDSQATSNRERGILYVILM